MGGCKVHTEAELCIIFKEGVCPCGAVTLLVYGVGAGGSGTAVNGGTAGCVCNDHPVAEELGNKLYIGSLAAACACAGEFEHGLEELAALDGCLVDGQVEGGQIHCEVPVIVFNFFDFCKRSHLESLCLCGANIDAAAAAGAVIGADLNSEELAVADAGRLLGNEGFGCFGLFGHNEGTDACMRTYKSTLVALDAVFGDPHGNFNCDAALFVLGGAGGNIAVGSELADGQLVALLSKDGLDEINEIRIVADMHCGCAACCGCPCFGVVDFGDAGNADVDCGIVLLNNVLTLLCVALLCSCLHVIDRLVCGDDFGKLEECALHDGVDAVAHADFAGELNSIHVVETNMLLCNGLLH